MDAKYFEEIKARLNKKLTGRNKFHGYIATKSSKHGDGVYDAIINRLYQCEYEDIPVLIEQHKQDDKQIVNLKAELHAAVETANMWTDAEGKQREENATLKKAFELMVGEIKSCVMKMSKAGIVRITAWGSDEQCIDYFMRKAQAQLTHESTHGDAESETQSGNKADQKN